MEKFVPYEKLSKKEKRKMDLAKRQTWGELNPVTRKPENSKAYNRRKAQSWKRDSGSVPFLMFGGDCTVGKEKITQGIPIYVVRGVSSCYNLFINLQGGNS